jgi:hypothetical protein
MFSKRNKQFLFQEPLSKTEKKSLEQRYEYNAQVIICGAHAKEVIAALKDLKSDVANEKDTYAFRFRQSGTVNIEVTVDVKSDVKYQETHKKKIAEHTFDHKDIINKDSATIQSYSRSYEICEPDFQTDGNLFVAVASKDNDETKKIISQLGTKLANRDVSDWILSLHPDESKDGGYSFTFGYAEIYDLKGPVTQCCISNNDNYASIAKTIEEKLKKSAKAHIDNLEKGMVNQTSGGIMKEFEDTLHKKADEFFAEKERGGCVLM